MEALTGTDMVIYGNGKTSRAQ